MIDHEIIEMMTSDSKMYIRKKSINTREYNQFDIIMLNNTSMSFPNYCSLQTFLSKPIRYDRYPSIITWKQINRQQREYGIEYIICA
jgi:hypothetical protein